MKKNIGFVLILLINLNINAQKKIIKPITKKTPVTILVGKRITYYSLTEKLDFKVDNNQKITIYSRAKIDKTPVNYTLAYSFDNGNENLYTVTENSIDKHCAFTKKTLKKSVSKVFKKEIDVPKNAKILHLYLKSKEPVLVKVKSVDKKLKPVQKTKKIKIIKGKNRKYYKLNSKIPTVIKVNGKGKLIVYTRKRLTKKDSGKYRFSYQKDHSKPKTVEVNKAKKSKHAVYRSLKITKKPSVNHKTVMRIKTQTQIIFSSHDNVDAKFIFIEKK